MTGIPSLSRLCALPVDDLLAAFASGEPTPGGGSASALAGALGSALVTMVARLSLARDSYSEHQQEMTRVRARAAALQHDLAELADTDSRAYGEVTAALRLPKDTPQERATRSAAVQAALRGATEVPLEVATACMEVLQLASLVANHGNRNAVSDAAVGALLAHAGLRGAALNVRINLQSIRDDPFRESATSRLDPLLATGGSALATVLTAAGTGE
jgi:formiminotetrahydrofolate cyclodeaminase